MNNTKQNRIFNRTRKVTIFYTSTSPPNFEKYLIGFVTYTIFFMQGNMVVLTPPEIPSLTPQCSEIYQTRTVCVIAWIKFIALSALNV